MVLDSVYIGPRGVLRTPRRGRFRCPHCDAARTYAFREMRSVYVVLSVPVIPLRGSQSFVQCGFCRRAFRPEVLRSLPPGVSADADHNLVPPEWLASALASRPASTLLVWREDEGRRITLPEARPATLRGAGGGRYGPAPGSPAPAAHPDPHD